MRRWSKQMLPRCPSTCGAGQGTCRRLCSTSGQQNKTPLGKGTNPPQEGCCKVVLIGTDNPSGFHRLIDFPQSFPAITALVSFPSDLKMGQRLFLDFPTRFRVQYETQECEAAFHCLVLVKYEQGNHLIQSVWIYYTPVHSKLSWRPRKAACFRQATENNQFSLNVRGENCNPPWFICDHLLLHNSLELSAITSWLRKVYY